MSAPAKKHWVAVICLALVAITFAVFGRTAGFGFVNYDDDKYVYENPEVTKGLTLQGAAWALTHVESDYWHPLTWLTHMADCQVFGLWAGGHHLTNVALHALAAMFLFLALNTMSGSLWRSAFVAAVFAIHPLRVESVAWITERKDVLSGVFFMLTLWVYAHYARRPLRGRYVAVVVLYGLGLSCKNTLVTLPFVLLLLDGWPLQRVTPFWGLVKEKIPLFLLSVASCATTALLPKKGPDFVPVPFLERMGNAMVSYGIYLRQMIYPAGLAVPYINPPSGQPFMEVALAFAVLTAISIVALVCRKKRPYLLVGWLWYLGMLVPMIGIVQISYYAHADRYTYLPQIGIYVAVTWLVAGWVGKQLAAGLMVMVIAVLMFCSWQQTAYWQNSETLWTHTLACTTGNYITHNNLGDDFMQKGSMDKAILQYQKALQINPGYAEAHYNLGNIFRQTGKLDDAIAQYQSALQINPLYENAHCNLGIALLQKGRSAEAISHFQQALQIIPADPEVLNNLAWLLATDAEPSLRNGSQAVELAQKANALTGGENPIILHTLAAALAEAGRFADAKRTVQKAIELAQRGGRQDLVEQLNGELKRYEAGLPLHDAKK